MLVFDSTIWGNFKHNNGYDIGCSNNNIGSYRIKIRYWELVHQCWYLTVQYGEISSTALGTILVVHITILGLVGSKIGYWELVHQCWVLDSII